MGKIDRQVEDQLELCVCVLIFVFAGTRVHIFRMEIYQSYWIVLGRKHRHTIPHGFAVRFSPKRYCAESWVHNSNDVLLCLFYYSLCLWADTCFARFRHACKCWRYVCCSDWTGGVRAVAADIGEVIQKCSRNSFNLLWHNTQACTFVLDVLKRLKVAIRQSKLCNVSTLCLESAAPKTVGENNGAYGLLTCTEETEKKTD